MEFLPEENGDNYEYLYRVKQLAKEAGLEYYAKVVWKKGNFVANTGRKSKNTEEIAFFTKGKARNLRPDAKKDRAEPGIKREPDASGGKACETVGADHGIYHGRKGMGTGPVRRFFFPWGSGSGDWEECNLY